ncbi:MAG TPA: SPW repeat protein [Candidatus Eremiobacteraceae bacterium]|nr:SPW repeat protein [Candidatus Eremiobacteraceae bacterium]
MQQVHRSVPYTWAQWINVGIGIAAIIAPFVANADTAAKTSGVIVGIIIGVIAIISFFLSRSEGGGVGISWINILAGIWLLISTSFARDPQLVWQDVVYGILAIVTAIIVMGLHNINLHYHHTTSS